MHIYDDIKRERERQDHLWGSEFDDKHTINDWVTFITRHVSNSANTGNSKEQRSEMVKTAAIAVAALEAFDRNNGYPKRHYEV